MQDLIDNKIKNLREKLNKLLEDGADYNQIYALSLELDELILEVSN